jgi:hypothetical protein
MFAWLYSMFETGQRSLALGRVRENRGDRRGNAILSDTTDRFSRRCGIPHCSTIAEQQPKNYARPLSEPGSVPLPTCGGG